jgi:hypothetical protein
VKREGNFPPEPPTLPMRKEQRAAKLVRDWNACTPERKRVIERMAEKLSLLPKVRLFK